ncbi:hypothetical protein TRFO_26751 [Tritrichomonas foetus]|uniref:Uncharacterized protein n=1 Tax=Tritrichomonas foetus TaxID=1144522 RepID=A0A1J4K709_9EUKA|nr:hypothetical protein TRFO_26751 [Tritrichomonas foetus]|eukprot:OHT05484.1 hypothetical protein TRFO_26751 [Tritrichomonas foetus]
MKKTRPMSSFMSCRDAALSPSFQSSFRATPVSFTRDYITEYRGGSNSPLITLHKTPTSMKAAQRSKAAKVKREIYQWLSEENPPAIDVLKRVAECPTMYSKLILMACEEMSYSLGPVRSEGIDELERNSTLNNAKLEVEIQQQQEKLLRVKREAKDISEKLQKSKQTLNTLNCDIDRLQKLSTLHGVDDEKKGKNIQENREFVELVPTEIKLNDEVYRELWNDQQTLTEVIQLLQDKLSAKQKEQVVEMRKYIRRKFARYRDLPV